MCWVGNAMTRRFVSSKLRRPQIIHSLPTLARTLARWRARRERIGLVPTMGALHAGHLALVKRAQRRADRVIVSIFVNPTQFAPTEDLKTYPRTFDADIAALARVGADLVWAPSAETMYPRGFATRVVPEGPATVGLEDAFRPHFFAGVATVVAKLFVQCDADIAAFGEKDYQQLKVVTQMARDLDLKTRIVAVPTVRERDGLALSSRNAYLSRSRTRDRADAASRSSRVCGQDRRGSSDRRRADRRPRGAFGRGLHRRLFGRAQRRYAGAGSVSQGRPAPPPGRRAPGQDPADRQYRGVKMCGVKACGLGAVLLAAGLHRVLDGLVGGELHAVELPVHLLDFADVDVLHDVARFRIDGDRAARAFPGHALHRREQDVAVGIAVRLLQRLIDQVQAIIGAERNEIGTKAVRLLEGRDISLVERGIVRGRIRNPT